MSPFPRITSTCIALSVLLASAEAQRTLSPAEMEEDLFQLTGVLEEKHPGLLRYSTREEMDGVFGRALHAVEEERGAIEFYRIVAEVVATIRCGHTRAEPAVLDARAAVSRRGLLPLELLWSGDRLFVLRALDGSIRPGAEVLSIDGLTVAELRSRAFARMSADGFVETGRRRELAAGFARLYAYLVQEEVDGPFRVLLAGEEEARSVAEMSPAEFQERQAERTLPRVIDLDLCPEEDLAILTVSAFADDARGGFPSQLEEAFLRVEETGVGHLVLDLRGNGGGQDMYGAFLVAHLSPVPFRYFDRIEVTKDYQGQGGIVERDGSRLVTEHPGTDLQRPAEHRFEGRAWALIDGDTFSTAADVAAVIHARGLAELVGEETGGGYAGNTSGPTEVILLAHSGITVSLPKWCYWTADVESDVRGRGVPPAHALESTVEDVLAGRDRVLEFVLDRIRAGDPPPR